MASRQNEKISALHEVLWKQGLPVHSSPLQLVAREVPEPPWHPLPGGAADREKIRYLTAHFLRYQLEAGTVTGQDGVESLAGYSAPVDAPAIRTGEWPAGNSRRRGDGRFGIDPF